MKIKQLKLHNIRSYTDCTIKFEDGTTLLAGDVGAGKSSMLLAIEFALFGITKYLDGNALLRNGSNSGYVEMDFDVEGKDVSVKRSLSRAKGITQDEGCIKIDDITTRCSALELKQRILDLLNYPKELLTKSKGLIYRYTVYTPQEEIKKILQEDDEIRIDILRRVFGVDKYKRIRENTGIYSNSLREKAKALALYSTDADAKKKELRSCLENEERLKNEIGLLQPRIEEVKKSVEEKKKNLDETEAKIKESSKIRNDIEVGLSKIKYLKNEITGIENEIKSIDGKINENAAIEKVNENIDVLIKNEMENLGNAEKQHQEITGIISVARAGIDNSNLLMEKVGRLATCPLCKQNVSEEHKHSMRNEEEKKTKEHNEKLNEALIKEKNASENIALIKTRLENLKLENQKDEINKIRIKNLNELKARGDEIAKKHAMILSSTSMLEAAVNASREKLASFGNADEIHASGKNDLEKYNLILRELEIKYSAVNARFYDSKKIILMLENEVRKKQDAQKKMQKTENLRSWLNDVFAEMVDVMEKKVMSKIYSNFNELFKNWFNVIMSDESLNVNLDNEFNPAIEQNGYDTEYSNLSGGEKTAIALAYRLALNQVINNLVSSIKTNDLIVLDEPTDGFSDEQITRIKDVLDELNIKQVIVVSHEPKIESFVDNVIKIKKENHVSYAA